MAFELHRTGFPGIAASAVNPNQAVAIAGGGNRQFVPIASNNLELFGVALATAAQGEGLTVMDHGNVVKVPAIASIGRNADVGVASTNGALGLVAAASGAGVWSIGKTMSAGGAGEQISLYVRPRQLSGLA